MDDNRYIKPQSATEALELIQRLFNSYRNAPLTDELLNYHLNLINRLGDDIKQAAIAEGREVEANRQSLVQSMETWTRLRLAGKPYPGKVKNFKLVVNSNVHFKARKHRIKGTGGHRSSRH